MERLEAYGWTTAFDCRAMIAAVLVALCASCDGDRDIVEGAPCDGSSYSLTCIGNDPFDCECTSPNSYDGFVGFPVCDRVGYTWVKREHCDVMCDTSIDPYFGCISSTMPVPECDGVDLTCWNGERHACAKGYPLQSPSCSEVLPGSTCTIMPACGVVCKPPETDPQCPQADENTGLCVGNTAIFCQCGYLTYSQDCGSDECHTDQVYEGNGEYRQGAMCGYLP